jgi:hypothetical protein
MYKAWICYPRNDWDDPEPPVILFYEPEKYLYSKIIPIAFYELKEFPNATSF